MPFIQAPYLKHLRDWKILGREALVNEAVLGESIDRLVNTNNIIQPALPEAKCLGSQSFSKRTEMRKCSQALLQQGVDSLRGKRWLGHMVAPGGTIAYTKLA